MQTALTRAGVCACAHCVVWLSVILLTLAAVAWAVYGLAQKQLLRWLPSPAIMVCIYGGCAVLLSPLSTPSQLLQMGSVALGMLVFSTLNTLVAYGTFAEALAWLQDNAAAASGENEAR